MLRPSARITKAVILLEVQPNVEASCRSRMQHLDPFRTSLYSPPLIQNTKEVFSHALESTRIHDGCGRNNGLFTF